jgi:hypothetical protein
MILWVEIFKGCLFMQIMIMLQWIKL